MIDWRNSFPLRQARVRPLACFTVMALAGMLLARRFDLPLAVWLACAGAVTAGIISFRLRRRRALMLIMLLGICLGGLRMTAAVHSIPDMHSRFNVRMEGRVVSDPFVKTETGRLIMRFRLDEADGMRENTALRLYLRGDEEALSHIAYGQALALTGHIWANDPVTNPCEFDFGEYLHRDGTAAMATARIEDVEIAGQTRDLPSIIVDIRHAIARQIDRLFPQNAAMVRALVLGDRSRVSEEARASLSATGTAHLIAISGLHVTVLAMAMSAVLSLVMKRRTANLVSLGPLLFYGALIGFSASFVRALVMFGIFSLGSAEGLPSDPITRLAAALLGYLAVNPLSIGGSGLILSFTASAGIILLMPPIQALLGLQGFLSRRPDADPVRRALHALGVFFPALLCASLAAQLATLPAVIACFGVQSVISIPFNLVCVPLCMIGYIQSMIALAFSALYTPLGALLAVPADCLFSLMLWIMGLSLRLPLTGVRVGRYPPVLILLHASLVLAASELCAVPRRVRRFLPLSLILVTALSSAITWLGSWPFSVTFLNAEQADCAVVRTQGHTYVFDTGDTYTPLADYLNGTALNVDAVFLSHPHQDHAGGLLDLLDSFQPKAIYVPTGWFEAEDATTAVVDGIDRARKTGAEIIELCAGDVIPLSSRAACQVYHPAFDTIYADANDMSLLLNVRCGGHSILFTGDLTENGEPPLIPDCDILKVAHHGASGATSDRFLRAATPEIAVISVGENNYGHPDDATVARLKNAGAAVLRTDQLGAITLTAADDGWRVKTYLEAPDEME